MHKRYKATYFVTEQDRTPKFSKVFRMKKKKNKNQEDKTVIPNLPSLFILDLQLIFTNNLELGKLANHGYGKQTMMD